MSTLAQGGKDMEHKVTFLSGGRPGESYTAQCSCGKWFESTHNTYRQRAIKLHLNHAAKVAAK